MFLANALQTRANLENPDIPLIEAFGGGGARTYSGKRITNRKSFQVSAVHAIIRVFAETVSWIPFVMMQRTEAGLVPRPDHPAARLLNVWANERARISAFNLRQLIMAHVLGWGNFYAEIEMNQAGEPAALWPIFPEHVTRIQKDGFTHYKVDIGGEHVDVPGQRMLHLYGLSLDGLTGVNPLQLMKEATGIALSHEEYLARFAKQDMTPSGIIMSEKAVGDTRQKELLKSWDETQTGVKNKWRLVVLSGGLKYQQISLRPADVELLETRKFTIEEFCRAYRCPPHMVALLDKASYNNVATLDRAFAKHSLRPHLKMIEQGAWLQLLQAGQQDFWKAKHELDVLLEGEPEEQAKYWETGVRGGWLNPDEIRESQGRNPREDGLGGKYMVSVQYQYAEDLAAEGNAGAEGSREQPADAITANERAEAWGGADERRAVAQRAAARIKLQSSKRIRALIESAAARVVAMENRELSKAVKLMRKQEERAEGGPEDAAFLAEAEAVYNRQAGSMAAQIRPTLNVLGESVLESLRTEMAVDSEVEDPPLDAFAASYSDRFAERYAEDSMGQLRTAVATGGGSKAVQAVLDRWKKERAEDVAEREHRRFGNAATSVGVKGYGGRILRWLSIGSSCPACRSLDGQVREVGKPFEMKRNQPGVNYFPPVLHPPLHGRSCDCLMVPG